MSACYNGQVATNTRCIVITFILALGYWFLPHHNKWVLLAILYFTYLAIAWYDHWYQCQRNLGPTYLAHFYAPLKPQDSDQIQKYKNMCPAISKKIWIIDGIVFGVLLVLLPFFLKWNPSK